MTNEDLITHHIAQLKSVADSYPGVVIVLTANCRRVLYMSERGLQQLHTTQAELDAIGEEYHPRFFNPDEAHEYVPQVAGMLERNELGDSATLFQQVRTGPDRTFQWYLSTVQVLARDAAGQPLLVISFAVAIDPESNITVKVQRLLDENNFLRTHAARFALLTQREREVLRGLVLGQSSPELAETLNISVGTADTHRRNLRQKLGATTSFELGQYARAFDLV